jgi:hypothetical protein
MLLLRAHRRAVDLDLPDLVDFMLGTGVRIGEALAVRHGTDADGEGLLDLGHATVEINATIVRVKAEGLVIQAWPKTDAGWRRLALPPYVVTMLERRSRELRFTPPEGVISARRSDTCATPPTPPVTCARYLMESVANTASSAAGSQHPTASTSASDATPARSPG